MSDKIVAGKDYVFYAFRGGIWKPFICARSSDDPVQTDFIETTVTGSGNWKTFEPTVHSFNKNIDGIMAFNDAVNLTWPELRTIQFAKEKLLCRTVATSQAGDTYTEEAYCFISNSVPTGSFDGVATFRVGFQGTGSITQIYTPPSPTTGEVFRYPAMGASAPPNIGSFTATATGLAGKNILEVVKNGQGSNDIILSGTPVNQEVLYQDNGADGDFTWAFEFQPGETWYCLYQNL